MKGQGMNGDGDNACPSEEMAAIISATRADPLRGLARMDEALEACPRDARLHFLRGSVLAGLARYAEAHGAMATAVAIAPDFGVARFQLGFLELTSGDAAAAQTTWRPLERLAPMDPLRVFVEGLRHLINDRFAEAVQALERGIDLNDENPSMNADMQLIIEKLKPLTLGPAAAEPVSAAQLLLRQFTDKTTRH
jgi:tetratricopeptide (TPR) repeat protein